MMPKLPGHAKGRGPDAVDLHAAAMLYALRHAKGMSQQALADALGVSFQQVQKYERAKNRMSASTLYHAARALDVPVIRFFAGLDTIPDAEWDLIRAAGLIGAEEKDRKS